MDNWFEFVVERYNYWIVITLMMTGLYIVFARGNLVKKIVGLNLFQTSVFIFYITMGKIAGGTAPIYMGGEIEKAAAGHGKGEGAEGLHDAAVGAGHEAVQGAVPGAAEDAESLHSKIENTVTANDLKAGLNEAAPADAGAPSLHDAPVGDAAKISNDALAAAKPEAGFDVSAAAGHHDAAVAGGVSDVAHHAGEIIYTNPLPAVLILTAIVVGVATTAVGLALAVRIREAYGTIEEDELEAADDIAEFGEIPGQPAGDAA